MPRKRTYTTAEKIAGMLSAIGTVGQKYAQAKQQQEKQQVDDTGYEETDYGSGALPDYAPDEEMFPGANPDAQQGYSNVGARGIFGGSANQQSKYEGLTPLAMASEQFGQDQSNDSFNQALKMFGIKTGQKQQGINNQQGLQQNYFNQGQQLNNMNNQQKDQYMQQLYKYLGLGGGAQNPMFT